MNSRPKPCTLNPPATYSQLDPGTLNANRWQVAALMLFELTRSTQNNMICMSLGRSAESSSLPKSVPNTIQEECFSDPILWLLGHLGCWSRIAGFCGNKNEILREKQHGHGRRLHLVVHSCPRSF